jgi:flagellar motor switch protein FliG
MADELTGRQKAAVFLISLGTESASEIFKCLPEDEVETLTFEIARMESIGDEQIEGIDFAREVLETAFGAQKAIDIINKLTASLQIRLGEAIRRTDDPTLLLNFIQQGYSQAVALILAYLDQVETSHILSGLPQEVQNDLTLRIAAMDRTNPEFLREIAKEHPEDVALLIETWL